MIDVDPEIVEICKKRVMDHIARVKFFYRKVSRKIPCFSMVI